jgi:hypothetical protein
MGGANCIIQIDETLLRGRRKHNRGRFLLGDLNEENIPDSNMRRANYGQRIEGPWVFGLIWRQENIEEESRPASNDEVRLFVVEKRDADTLLGIIGENVEGGSTIWSDGWAAYHGLSNMGFTHQIVIREDNFVDRTTGCNTQLIENIWLHVKKLIIKDRRGTTESLLQSHLDEYCFRRRFKKCISEQFLKICNSACIIKNLLVIICLCLYHFIE